MTSADGDRPDGPAAPEEPPYLDGVVAFLGLLILGILALVGALYGLLWFSFDAGN